MAFGIAAADLLEACYNASAANVEERYRAVWARRGASESDTNFDRWSEAYEVATSCSNRLLNTGTSELGLKAHVGKSLYAEQLAHWFARIPEELFWLEALEDFAAEPRRAFERVLEWLGVPAYGRAGKG
ncbi:hypothetical protein SO694_00032170 [Aureococcus anophagefferens]|uniref:Sulfotransferase domain-containing protein n=1 Tax=Aureococcus anophagefferens TaxID=44056 RepID=A0ABR1FK95_AURAN|nr:hypothetical protein JL721_5018 [Aureococcus anophagefferens]KAH8093561.1 hypothetical protein JL720_4699 [Aureococcus anophagefferens]